MKSWRQAVEDALVPGVVAGAAVSLMAARRGRADTGSGIAALNAPSHFLWGESAAEVEQTTLRHTLPGVLVNTGATVFWAAVMEKLFGEAIERHGLSMALLGGAVTSGIAYVTDYHVVPKRLTPGFELRVSGRSLFRIYVALALGLAGGALLEHERSDGR